MRAAPRYLALLFLLTSGAATAGPGAGSARPAAEARKPWEILPAPPAMPKPAATGRVPVSGGAEIYYAELGKAGAPAVILLHGGLGNGDHFAHQVPALEQRFRVIAIDSRGQGRSTLGKEKLTYRAMARDVVAVMDHLKLERASMVGWSDGGAIALALGIEHPRRVERLFVVGTNYDSTGAKARSGPSTTFNEYAARCRADLARLLGAAKGQAAYAAANAALGPVWREKAPFREEELRAIAAPALVAVGTHDEIIALAHVKKLGGLLPKGRFVELPDTSHFAMWQAPEAFNQVLVAFLTER